MAIQRQALQNVSGDVDALLALIASGLLGKQYDAARQQAISGINSDYQAGEQARIAPINAARTVGFPVANAAMQAANVSGSPVAEMPTPGMEQPRPAPQPELMAILARMLSQNPNINANPGFARDFQTAQVMAPVPFTANAGDVYGTRDRFTGKVNVQGIVPKQTMPELPPGFAQMVPEAQSRFFNQLPGREGQTTVNDFRERKPDDLINSFQGKGNKQMGLFRKQDGTTYLKEIGDLKDANNAKSVEQGNRVRALSDSMKIYKDVLSHVPSGRIGGTIAKGMALVEQNDWARAAGGMEASLAGSIARTVNGEVGVLTDQDIERAKKFIPLITDTDSERELKFSLLDEMMKRREEAFRGENTGNIAIDDLEARLGAGPAVGGASGAGRFRVLEVK